MTRRVLIVTHGGRPEAVVALREAVRELEGAGFTVTLHDDGAGASEAQAIDATPRATSRIRRPASSGWVTA